MIRHTRSLWGVVFAVVLSSLLTLQSWVAEPCLAQTLVEDWSEPVPLYSTENFVSNLNVILDRDERFHVFWIENPTKSTSRANLPGTILTLQGYPSEGWSAATDVLVSTSGRDIRSYHLFVDASRDLLHSVYLDTTPYYTSVPLSEAQNARAWAIPENLLFVPVISAKIQFSGDQRYLVYIPNQIPYEVTLLQSDVEAIEWSSPAVISDAESEGEIPTSVQLYVDRSGVMHLVWGQSSLPDGYPPRRIAYSRSVDNGQTWSASQTLAEGQFASPGLTETPAGNLLLLYVGAIDIGGRYYQISTDAGETWSETAVLAEGIGGLTGASYDWDSGGTLHYVSASHLRGLNGIAYLQWREMGQWIGPVNVLRPGDVGNVRQAYEPILRVTEGNRLHVFYLGPDHSTIYYTHARSASPGMALPPRVTPSVSDLMLPEDPTDMVTEEATRMIPNPVSAEINPDPPVFATSDTRDALRPIWMGAVAATFIAGFAVMGHFRRSRS